jgi:ATP-binding cassette, subfamily G (WHITE), member 2, PDR
LTSLSSPEERLIRSGYENKVPRTPEEFALVWQRSEEHARLLQEIGDFEEEYPIGGASLGAFTQSRKAMQAKSQYGNDLPFACSMFRANVRRRSKSPYTLSIPMQIKLCMRRGFQRLQKDMALLISGIISNSVMALVIGSMFYNLPNNTGSLYNRSSSLFFAILLAAFASGLEVGTPFDHAGA